MEIGWLAGILEGEGSICLQVSKRSGQRGTLCVVPKIILTNSDMGLIEACVSILGKLGVGKYVLHTNAKPSALAPRATKAMHYVHISGHKRVLACLDALTPAIYGDKKRRAELLRDFIIGRLEGSLGKGTAKNVSYDEADVARIMAFVEITQTKQAAHIRRMLNEHTKETKVGARKSYKRIHGLANRELQNAQRKERRRRLRCALDSQETARVARNEQPLL